MGIFCFSEKKSILEGDFGENGFLKNLRTKNVFTLRNIKKTQCPKMVSKAVQLYYLRSYVHFLFFRKKIHPRGWLWSKWFFGKFTHKKRFYTQKHQKKSISKNGVKSRLALLFKELWAFLFFGRKKNPSYRATLE